MHSILTETLKKKIDVIMDTVVLIALTVTVMKMLNNHWKDQSKVRKDMKVSLGKTNIQRGWSAEEKMAKYGKGVDSSPYEN